MNLKQRIAAGSASVVLLTAASLGLAGPAQAAQIYKEFSTPGNCHYALSQNLAKIKKTSTVLYAACTYSSSRGVWMHILTFKS
ncbi:hypothetical protein [Cellulomonas shaoxiangyii]|uniref:Uncharacterized protein n=1 Tax=Cellulomonas shaoxiangyii TaxID=2566013 RepID=A0A4P7SDY6_9CELL|nr:hypothetical protein [Cellulomonas shaoxiangyii]QCB92212.1 hypothetical protein E5225_00225 [Cellulomonas shaoxiangyii]TGY82632.1 hypothetical protein E5226_13045 [Cellulomonas shaoxiangyii]